MNRFCEFALWMPRITFTQSLLRPVKETLMNRFTENITRTDFGHKNDPFTPYIEQCEFS